MLKRVGSGHIMSPAAVGVRALEHHREPGVLSKHLLVSKKPLVPEPLATLGLVRDDSTDNDPGCCEQRPAAVMISGSRSARTASLVMHLDASSLGLRSMLPEVLC